MRKARVKATMPREHRWGDDNAKRTWYNASGVIIVYYQAMPMEGNMLGQEETPKSKNRVCQSVSLLSPQTWLSRAYSAVKWTPLSLLYLGVGVALNLKWAFPNLHIFLIMFVVILLTTFFAEKHYLKKMTEICGMTVAQKPFTIAKHMFYTKWEKSGVYVIAPFATILFFGIGGCLLFQTIALSPTLIWVLALFAITVYVSIVGYIQYILLALFIRSVAKSQHPYEQMLSIHQQNLPPEIDWLTSLAKLSHYYRTVFFTIGLLYILAFGLFCQTPAFGVSHDSICFYILWGAIIIAIALIFPIVSLFEHSWLKQITKKVKNAFIADVIFKVDANDNAPPWVTSLGHVIRNYCISIVLNTDTYPIKNRLSSCYAIFLALLNLVCSAITILQFGGITPR